MQVCHIVRRTSRTLLDLGNNRSIVQSSCVRICTTNSGIAMTSGLAPTTDIVKPARVVRFVPKPEVAPSRDIDFKLR
jgi:hypothetical protein